MWVIVLSFFLQAALTFLLVVVLTFSLHRRYHRHLHKLHRVQAARLEKVLLDLNASSIDVRAQLIRKAKDSAAMWKMLSDHTTFIKDTRAQLAEVQSSLDDLIGDPPLFCTAVEEPNTH